jgi:hypothetical protein
MDGWMFGWLLGWVGGCMDVLLREALQRGFSSRPSVLADVFNRTLGMTCIRGRVGECYGRELQKDFYPKSQLDGCHMSSS